MDTKELLGSRMRYLRKKRGLTQERLAEIANVDVKYMGNIERGRENPTIGVLEKIASALVVKIHQLLDFEHEVRGKRLLRRHITRVLDTCDERELQTILKLVNAMKE